MSKNSLISWGRAGIVLLVGNLLSACGDAAKPNDTPLGTGGTSPGSSGGGSGGGSSGKGGGVGGSIAMAGGSGGNMTGSGGASGGTGNSGAAGGPGAGMAGMPISGAPGVGGGGGMPPGGTGGTGGAAAGGSATGGAGATSNCKFEVQQSLSTAIPTVGIVTWSTNLTGIDGARIEFAPQGGTRTLVAPVQLNEPEYRTLLLGMKGSREYVYRIIATAGATTCTSPDYMLTTGAVPSTAPQIEVSKPGAGTPGFIVTCGGVALGGGGGGTAPAYIFDTDGDVVWWAAAPGSTSAAHMDYEGKNLWMLTVNVGNSGGEMRRVSMDGLDVENNVAGLSKAHHDFTVLPNGRIAAMLWNGSGADPHNSLVERAADGTFTTIVADFNTLYQNATYHPNRIHYYADDTYTISDRNPNLFVKLKRTGELLWQFGGTNPISNHFAGSWQVNHGHALLADGRFLLFNNGQGNSATKIMEYQLNEASWTATKLWEYDGPNSMVLGDVQRLPNGNTLATYSTDGVIQELDTSQSMIQSYSTASFGYSDFRDSLYGKPLR